MPRKSGAALAITPPVGVARSPRLPAPAGLTTAERATWRSITASLPAGWFKAEQAPLLVALCRHQARADGLAALLVGIDAAADLDRWRKVAAEAREEARVLLALARSLRLTLQAREQLHPRTAANAARRAKGPGPRPWEA